MAVTVTHTKVSTIPDDADTSLIRPSDWNATHTLSGIGTMATQDANAVAITGGTISGVTIPASNITGTLTVPYGGTGATTLTGYVKGAGTTALSASSTIPNTDITGLGTASTKDAGAALGVATLDSAGKVPISQIPDSVIGALSYQGTWDASTNTPTLTSSVGTKGYYYVVSAAGSTNLNGITDWKIGDWAVYSGTAWQKIDNTDGVTSVNGYTGAVVLTTTDVAEGTNQYFTTARARTSVSAGTGISYNNTTGVITNSSPSLGGDVVGPASATDNAVARYDTTTGKLIQNSVTLIDDTGNASGILSQQFSNGSAVTLAAGKMWYDGSTGAWNAGMGNGNITQQIGEELFVYGKASAAINDSPLQCIYQTGTVGASGVITFAPTIAGITDGESIIGIATESIALNGFGRVTSFGTVRGITTNGTAYGETWADGDKIWYNPVTGGLTKVKPVAPNIKVQVGIIINAGSGGSGSFSVELAHGSELGGTDSNVELSSPTAAQLLTYSTTSGYWKNTSLAAGTGISVGNAASGVITVTNSLPDQTVAFTNGTGISVTGTYPNFTVTNTSPSSGGTVTSVTGTAPVVSSGGNTPAISMAAATTSVSGYLTSTDWTTFNGKQALLVSGTNIKTINTNSILGSGDLTISASAAGSTTQVQYNNAGAFGANSGFTFNSTTGLMIAPAVQASNGLVLNAATNTTSYTILTGNNAMSVGPFTVATSTSITVPSGSRWVVL